MVTPSTTSALSLLAQAVGGAGPHRGLTPERYATTHTAWESASDQRDQVIAWMVEHGPPLVAHVTDRPVAVLGVGVGDGTVDVALAAALSIDDRAVEYHGVEPHGPSAAAFEVALTALGHPRLTVEAVHGGFDQVGAPTADLIHFVHSLYYVADPQVTLERALSLLRPGGAMISLTSPQEPVSALAALLAPSTGEPQWFAESVSTVLERLGAEVRTTTIDAVADVSTITTDPTGTGRDVLDFLIQADSTSLSATLLDLVHEHLAEISLPGPGHRIPHPLTAVIATR